MTTTKELINFVIKQFNYNVDRSIKIDDDSFELRVHYPNDCIEYEKIKSLKGVKDIVFAPFSGGVVMRFYLKECSNIHAALRISLRTERSGKTFSTPPNNSSLDLNESELCWISKMTEDLMKLLPMELASLHIDKTIDGYVSIRGLIMDELSIVDIKSIDASFYRKIELKKSSGGKKLQIKVTSNICNKKRSSSVKMISNPNGNEGN